MTEDTDSRSLGEILQGALDKARREVEPLEGIRQEVMLLGCTVTDTYLRWVEQALELDRAAKARSDGIVKAIHGLTWVVGVLGLIFLFK